jgi:hypothetical protein
MAIAQNFNKITPENMEAISGDPKAISQMMELVRRARELARLAEEHYKKNRILWVNQEISRLHKRHHERPQNNHPKPSWVVTTPRWNDFSKEAAQRVALRLQARLSRIETLSRTMQYQLAQQSLLRRQNLREDVREIDSRARSLKIAAARIYENTKKQRIETARHNGSKSPEIDVYRSYKKREASIESARQSALKRIHQKHSIPFKPQQNLTRGFNRML